MKLEPMTKVALALALLMTGPAHARALLSGTDSAVVGEGGRRRG